MKINDAHNDFLTKCKLSEIKDYIKLLKKNKVCYLACSCFTSETQKNKCFDLLRERSELLKKCKCKKYFLHIEDLYFADTKKKLKKIIEYKPFSCSLTWNYDNVYGGGAKGKKTLTTFGKYAVKMLEKNNILIDTAHANQNTFWGIAKLSKLPLYCSHTSFCFAVDNQRNLDDNQISSIINSHGFIGAFLFKDMITSTTESFDVTTYAKLVAKFIQKYGDNNIGLGTDFMGISNGYPKEFENYGQIQNLIRALKGQGLTKKSIKKVIYKNFEAFIKRVKKRLKKLACM